MLWYGPPHLAALFPRLQYAHTANQTVAAGPDDVLWQTAVDTGTGWTYASGVFTATRTGRAWFAITLSGYSIAGVADNFYNAELQKGGVMVDGCDCAMPVPNFGGGMRGAGTATFILEADVTVGDEYKVVVARVVGAGSLRLSSGRWASGWLW